MNCPACERPVEPELGVAQRDGVWHRPCWLASLERHMGVAPFPDRKT